MNTGKGKAQLGTNEMGFSQNGANTQYSMTSIAPAGDAVNPHGVGTTEIPEPTEPEEIKTGAVSAQPNPFTGNFTRLPDLLKGEFAKEDWVVDNLLCRGDLLVLHGQPKTGKSFVAIDLCISLATGTPWCGGRFQISKPRNVIFCSGEGNRGLPRRWKAAIAMREVTEGLDPVSFAQRIITVPIVPQLFQNNTNNSARNFVNAIKAELLEDELGLVVVDTLGRAALGAAENDAKDMGQILAAAECIQCETGAAVMLIHHSNKANGELRGSSALLGGVDASLKIEAKNGCHLLICDDAKDIERFDPLAFELFPVKSADSVAVRWVEHYQDDASKDIYADRIVKHMALRPEHWYTSREIEEELGISQKRVSECFTAFEKAKRVKVQPRNPEKNQSNRSNPKTYRLVIRDSSSTRYIC